MIDYIRENIGRLAPRLTYGGSAVTVTSAVAGDQAGVVGFSLYEFGIIVGMVTAIAGLALSAYFGWDKRRTEKSVAAAEIEFYKRGGKAERQENDQS